MNPSLVDYLGKEERRKGKRQEHDGILGEAGRFLVDIRGQNQFHPEGRRRNLIVRSFPELRVISVQVQNLPGCGEPVPGHFARRRQKRTVKTRRGPARGNLQRIGLGNRDKSQLFAAVQVHLKRKAVKPIRRQGVDQGADPGPGKVAGLKSGVGRIVAPVEMDDDPVLNTAHIAYAERQTGLVPEDVGRIDVQLGRWRHLEVTAECEVAMVENRLKQAAITHRGFHHPGHIQVFRQDMQVVEIGLRLPLVILEKGLERHGNKRAGKRLAISPFIADLRHHRVTPGLPFPYQPFYHCGRNKQ